MRITDLVHAGQAGRKGRAPRKRGRFALAAAIFALALVDVPGGVRALDRMEFVVHGADDAMKERLRAASLLLADAEDKVTAVEDLFTAAQADYGRLLAALYAAGHYSGVIHIFLDGREAAAIPPLDAPTSIDRIRVEVDPGPRFTFSRARIAPLGPETELPDAFAPGRTAAAGVVEEAVDAAILGWREAGNARARVLRDDVVADHERARLSADIALDPGPRLRFGPTTVRGAERMRVERIVKITGLRPGTRFSQSELDRAANRLRRTGIFSAVTLHEGETLVDGGLLPIEVAVTEQKTRRYSIGAEVASTDGISLSGMWMHRNLRGGGERLRVEGEITNIGFGESGVDYDLKVTLDRPATLTPDTTAGLILGAGHLNEIDYSANHAEFGLNFTHYFSEELTARAGLAYEYVKGHDPAGSFSHRSVVLPLGVTWDRRDSIYDAHRGFYIDATSKPFLGFGDTGSGVRATLDLRGYKSFGKDDGVTLAARLQGGAILGSDVMEAPRDDLFFTGGGGTVRGQPYRSLGLPVPDGSGGTFLIGGTRMLAASAEVRARVTKTIGIVGFVDAGSVGAGGFPGSSDRWHAGAGMGLRYATGFGPIRFDVAAPVHGDTGKGVQIYIGLGQAF